MSGWFQATLFLNLSYGLVLSSLNDLIPLDFRVLNISGLKCSKQKSKEPGVAIPRNGDKLGKCDCSGSDKKIPYRGYIYITNNRRCECSGKSMYKHI